MVKKIFIIAGILVLVSILFVSAQGIYKPIELSAEDYSFRSGLNYKIQYYGDLDGNLENGVELVKEEHKYWNTKYPFVDPGADFMENKYGPFDKVTDMVGYKSRVIRDPNEVNNQFYAGSVSHNIALIPYLEATKTIIRDKNGVSKTYGEMTKYDKWLNAIVIYNLGDVGNGDFSRGDYFEYSIRNPYAFDNPMNINSEFTNLQTSSDPIFTDTFLEDNTVTYINYLGDVDYYDPDEDFGTAFEHFKNLIKGVDNPDYNDAVELRNFYGWNNNVQHVLMTDGFGRVLSNTEIEYQIDNNYVEENGEPPEEGYNHLVFEKCDADSYDFSLEYYNCLANYKPKINPFDDSNPEGSGNNPDEHSKFCIRNSPAFISSYGDLARGYYALSESDIEPTKTVNHIVYDHCGNVLETDKSAIYRHAYEETPLIEHPVSGTSNIEYTELLHKYDKSVELSYSGLKFKPDSVTIRGDPSITTNAEYLNHNLIKSVTNERGITTEYRYDNLGRILKFWIPPDTEQEPTGIYYYFEHSSSGQGCPEGTQKCLVINEKRKIEDNKYTENYYFYDGMGRLIQTQAKENDNYMIATVRKYDVLNRVTHESKPKRVYIDDEAEFGIYYIDEGNFIYREYKYDALSRVIEIKDFDGSITKKDYYFSSGFISLNEYDSTNIEDPEGNFRTFYSDSKGNLVAVNLPTP